MREIIRNNKIIYNYKVHKISDGIIISIIFYSVAVFLLLISILISYMFLGEAPTTVAGVGIASLILNFASMIEVIKEIYLFGNYHREIKIMLLLQLVLFSIWIFIIF